MAEQQSARDLFRAAYENRYTWDKNFPGYTADVQLHQNGEVYTGKIRINSDLSFDVSMWQMRKPKSHPQSGLGNCSASCSQAL